MNILLIGNGFDVEHKLETKYEHFLDFSDWINEIQLNGISNKTVKKNKKYYEIYKKRICSMDTITELLTYIPNNKWIEYFKRRKTDIGQGWIDFESEVANIVNLFEKAKKSYYAKEPFGTYEILMEKEFKDYYEHFRQDSIKEYICGKEIYEEGKLLQDQLRNLIRAFEIYICYWVDKRNITVINPSISSIHIDKILSFNYSHTFNRVYGKCCDDQELCYVHGEARENSSLLENNMVLGIDDRDEAETEKDTFVTYFKKYYQRLIKNTDTKYEQWIEDIKKNPSKEHFLYIFGHSLDITDKDILNALITMPGVKTTIFYHSDKRREELLANLLKIIDKESVKERIKSGELRFVSQAASKEFKNSEVEVRSDINELYSIRKMPIKDIERIYDKISSKIETKNEQYFRNVYNVVDILNGLVLSNLYTADDEASLFEIAKTLIGKSSDDTILIADAWGRLTPMGVYEAESTVETFIDDLNEIIAKKKKRGRKSSVELFCELVIDIDDEKSFLSAYERGFEICKKENPFDERVINKLKELIVENPDVANAGMKMFEEKTKVITTGVTQRRRLVYASIVKEIIDEAQYNDIFNI